MIKTADKFLIFSVLVLSFLNIYLQFLKWKAVASSLLENNDNVKIFNSLFFGFAGGIITPIRIGEYLGRKLALEEQSLVKVTISTMIDKFAFLYCVMIIGGIVTAAFMLKYYSILTAIPIIILLVFLVVMSILIIKNDNRFQFLIDKLPQKFKFIEELKIELQYANKMDSGTVLKLVIYSLMLYVVIVFQYSLLALAFEPSGDLLSFLGAGSIILFAKSFLSFLSFADLGVRETLSVFLMKKLGYTTAVGFNSAFFLFLFNLLLPSIIGLFLFLKSNYKISDE